MFCFKPKEHLAQHKNVFLICWVIERKLKILSLAGAEPKFFTNV